MRDYYKILGIGRNASAVEIKKAYRRQAQHYHPDKNTSGDYGVEMFRLVKEAYDTLSNPIKKQQYDVKIYASTAYASPYEFTRYTYERPAEQQGSKSAQPPSPVIPYWKFFVKPLIFIILAILALYIISHASPLQISQHSYPNTDHNFINTR